MLAAEIAVRAWVNGNPALTGPGMPLANGAFLRQQRSPAEGAYAVLSRTAGSSDLVAEQDEILSAAGIQALVFSPSEETAETAAAALASAIEGLTGVPEPCGSTGIMILVSDNLSGPVTVPIPADSGELYCFQVSASFMLAQA